MKSTSSKTADVAIALAGVSAAGTASELDLAATKDRKGDRVTRPLGAGWFARFDLAKNANGAYCIGRLTIEHERDAVPGQGITTAVLNRLRIRSVRIYANLLNRPKAPQRTYGRPRGRPSIVTNAERLKMKRRFKALYDAGHRTPAKQVAIEFGRNHSSVRTWLTR